jgi:phage shock protein PspC (stress-responsive transcriptional regulator)
MPTHPRSFPDRPESDTAEDLGVTGYARAAGLPVPRLWRSRSNRVVAGVIGGLSEKFGMEPLPVRLLYGLLTIFSGGILAVPYFGIWAITRAHGPGPASRPLRRSRSSKVVAGVLGGLAEKLGIPALLTRLAYAALSVFSMVVPGVVVYLVLWAIMPVAED